MELWIYVVIGVALVLAAGGAAWWYYSRQTPSRAVCATGVGRRGYDGEYQRKRMVASLYVACTYVASLWNL